MYEKKYGKKSMGGKQYGEKIRKKITGKKVRWKNLREEIREEKVRGECTGSKKYGRGGGKYEKKVRETKSTGEKGTSLSLPVKKAPLGWILRHFRFAHAQNILPNKVTSGHACTMVLSPSTPLKCYLKTSYILLASMCKEC